MFSYTYYIFNPTACRLLHYKSVHFFQVPIILPNTYFFPNITIHHHRQSWSIKEQYYNTYYKNYNKIIINYISSYTSMTNTAVVYRWCILRYWLTNMQTQEVEGAERSTFEFSILYRYVERTRFSFSHHREEKPLNFAFG